MRRIPIGGTISGWTLRSAATGRRFGIFGITRQHPIQKSKSGDQSPHSKLRHYLSGLCLFLSAGWLLAAPVDDGRSKQKRVPLAEIEACVQHLQDIIHEVSRQFIRSDGPPDALGPVVSEQELTAAALAGLYEAARRPLPPAIVQQARTASDPGALHQLLCQARAELGNCASLRGSAAVLAGVRGMTPLLDPVSTIVSAQEVARSGFNEVDQNPGLEIVLGSRPVVVSKVLPGGPAQRAGLLPGDRILTINGVDAAEPILGPKPTTLTGEATPAAYASRHMVLTVEHPDTHERQTVRLECNRFRPETILGVVRETDNSWNYWIDRDRRIAHVRIAALVQGTADELAHVLEQLRADGLRGLVLDLRWCPGGVPDQIAAVVRLFLSNGVIMVLRDHDELRTARATEPAPFANLPLVVLVNGETMGGAELIAAALQDNRRAAITGQRTFGKATMQRLLPLPDAAYLKVTSGMLARPSGKNLQRHASSRDSDDWGVRPDQGLEFRVSPALAERLKADWLRQTLRPGGTRTALPLDNPEDDPQRQAAVRILRHTIEKQRLTSTR